MLFLYLFVAFVLAAMLAKFGHLQFLGHRLFVFSRPIIYILANTALHFYQIILRHMRFAKIKI